ncbi:MAG: exopolyphosphatase / guanosine-5-triphosphate,3-diphosphate pyrophosphatase [Thermoplasmata archaeon]|jgi:exopolyphosphatase/guanosine-5'-triphosphate,3'-diphosphate pyrophosphatase|nr:exopolyphosphatase / guanosine-5-triphosphate,3-diphosphate pyrophosphatase [Thermoplasmata archaeon]
MPRASTPFPLRVGCIDIGSNGVRCMAAEFADPAHSTVLLQERAPVRLGESVFRDGALAPAAMDQAVQALARFRGQMDALNLRAVRIVATSAVREAANREAFLRRAAKEAGVRVEPIGGGEEARLVALAVAGRLELDGKPWLVMDLGGGSLEVSLLDRKGVAWTESHPMGSVRLLEEFRAAARDPARFARLVGDVLGPLRLPGRDGRRLGGLAATGGNIEDLARLAGGDGGGPLPVRELERLADKLAGMTEQERVEKLGLRPDRADVILPAAHVYLHVARMAAVPAIHVPKVGLKEGVLLDLVGQLGGDAPRRTEQVVEAGAIGLGRRHQFDEAHGRQVARLALTLFDALRKEHGLGAPDRRILHAAALLHDVGRIVSGRKHHKHSQYLIAASELPGFPQEDVGLVGQVARYHRRKEPTTDHEAFAALSKEDQDRVERMAALLRVADALDRSHHAAVRELRVKRGRGKLTLQAVGEGDLLLEQWALQKKGGLFERIFKVGLQLEAGRA